MKPLSSFKHLVAGVLAAAVVAGGCRGAAPATPASPTPIQFSSPPADTSATAVSGATCLTGDGINDAGACNVDAQSYCGGFYGADWQSYARAYGYTTASWKYGLIDCLGKQNVSQACTTSLTRREVLNAQMMTSCATYCRGTSPQPGAEPCVDQLKSTYASLDNVCRAALDAHEAAKPLDGRCSA